MDNKSLEMIMEIKKDHNKLQDFADLEVWPHPAYFIFGEKYEKARPRQRGYIHGLSKKLNIDDHIELPYAVNDVRKLTVAEAAEVIEILREMVDKKENSLLF